MQSQPVGRQTSKVVGMSDDRISIALETTSQALRWLEVFSVLLPDTLKIEVSVSSGWAIVSLAALLIYCVRRKP